MSGLRMGRILAGARQAGGYGPNGFGQDYGGENGFGCIHAAHKVPGGGGRGMAIKGVKSHTFEIAKELRHARDQFLLNSYLPRS